LFCDNWQRQKGHFKQHRVFFRLLTKKVDKVETNHHGIALHAVFKQMKITDSLFFYIRADKVRSANAVYFTIE